MAETINQLYFESVEFEQFNLAYSLFVAAQHKVIQFSDPADTIDFEKFPHDDIQQALQNDTLGLIANSTKLFLIKRENDWAIYLAKNQQEAVDLHLKIFGEKPLQVIDNTEKMDTNVWDNECNKYMSFREIKKQTVTFPKYLFLMDGKESKKYKELVSA